jgi:anaerobic ribonucleoside-triphosphate reductase activating protein
MRILATAYTLKHKSLDIYISGCNGSPHCKGCHNPESWSFDNGDVFDKQYMLKIKKKIFEFNNMIENVMIFGGEPLDQNLKELEALVLNLAKVKNVWLFTRYDLDEVPKNISKYCSYIKCGRYEEGLKTDDNIQFGISLASSNQNIYKKDIDF